jgi:hypothetical protein
MNASLHDQPCERVATLLDSIEILSDLTFRIGGGADISAVQVPPMPGPAAAAEKEASPGSILLRDALATLVYAAAYSRVYDGGEIGMDILASRVVADRSFVARLSQANRSAERWDGGWRVYQADANGAMHIKKGDSATLARPGQYIHATATGAMPAVGAFVELFAPRESLVDQPSWYHAYGETVMSDHDNGRIGRLYFNVSASEAPWLVGALTGTLNRYAIPFRLKCPVDPGSYDRTDALVLYVARRFFPVVLRVLRPLAPELAARLEPGTPLFAMRLLAGMGAADDPGTGESFGQSRSRLVAEAVVATGIGNGGRKPRKDALAASFRRLGLDIERPHLAAGLTDKYAVDFEEGA